MQRILEPEVMDSEDASAAYDAMDHSSANLAFVERLFDLGVRGRVLDIGCGPGRIAVMIGERSVSAIVVGVDLAVTMLDRARRLAAEAGLAERLRFELADAKGLPYADAKFDVVCSNTILHHLPDPVPFLAEANRVLKPGGTLLIRDLYRPGSLRQAKGLVALYAGREDPTAQQLLLDSLRAALTPEELYATATQAGMRDFELLVDSDRHMSLQRKPALN